MREFGISPGRRRFGHLVPIGALIVSCATGCTRNDPESPRNHQGGLANKPGTKSKNSPIDPALARAVGRAIQPCILAQQASGGSVYTAELGLVPDASGAAVASFVEGRRAVFEACAVRAINAARMPIAAATTIPVAFDFRPRDAGNPPTR